MLIYKIFRTPEWDDLQRQGQTLGTLIDVADGFVHFSTALQANETCAKYFAGVDGLVLAALDADTLGADLIWEPSRGGALFPHLYRTLSLADILWHRDLPLGPTGHIFPDNML
jgi:uncharacterized protein (DUF952 family)